MTKTRILGTSTLLFAARALACSSCIGGGPLSPDFGPAHSHGEKFGLSLRHDYFAGDTLYSGAHRVSNTEGEYLRQNNTTLGLAYDIDDAWSLFFGVRHSAKSYRREEDVGGVDTMVSRTESGFTDPVLGAQYTGVLVQNETRYLALTLFGGVTLPVGNTELIGEEVEELTSGGGHHHGAVHDHDLAMGSGEYGATFMATLDYVEGRFLARASANYTWRPRGDYGYDFADNYGWDLAAGMQLKPGGHAVTGVALLAGITGEHAGNDRIDGTVYEHTENHTVYAGPRLRIEHDSMWQANLQLELPVYGYAAEAGLVSSWRARAGVTYRF